jgi:hypothetical protein
VTWVHWCLLALLVAIGLIVALRRDLAKWIQSLADHRERQRCDEFKLNVAINQVVAEELRKQ